MTYLFDLNVLFLNFDIRINLLKFRKPGYYLQKLLSDGVEGLSHFALIPMGASHYYRYIVATDNVDFAKLTTIIEYRINDCILAITKIGKLIKWSMLVYMLV